MASWPAHTPIIPAINDDSNNKNNSNNINKRHFDQHRHLFLCTASLLPDAYMKHKSDWFFFANGLSTIKFSHKFSHRMRQYNTVFPSKLGFIASIECNHLFIILRYIFFIFVYRLVWMDVNTLKTTQLIVWFKYSHCVSVSHHTTNAPQILI